MWHPFDDSRGLNDPHTSERGIRRPLEVRPLIVSFEQNITPYTLYIALKLYLKGCWDKEKLIMTSI